MNEKTLKEIHFTKNYSVEVNAYELNNNGDKFKIGSTTYYFTTYNSLLEWCNRNHLSFKFKEWFK
jgi:hypothetical protein